MSQEQLNPLENTNLSGEQLNPLENTNLSGEQLNPLENTNLSQEQLNPLENANLSREQLSTARSIGSRKRILKKSKRPSIPAKIRHQLQLRDRGQCTHKNHKGIRCTQRRFLEIHHITEVARGGKNELNNLTTLCFSHHKLQHL